MSTTTTHTSSYSKHDERDERLEESIRRNSPDGRPAHPRMRAKGILVLVGGSLLAVAAVSAATYALWGATEAFLVLSLGSIFAVIGNPVMWAMFFRSKERETIQENTHPEDREHTESGTH